MTGVLPRYHARIGQGILAPDPVQAEAAEALDDLARRLANKPKPGWFSKPDPVTGL